MCNVLARQFLIAQEKLDDKDYLTSTIAYTIAPIIEGKKPSYLTSFSRNQRNLYHLWEKEKPEYTEVFNVKFYEVCRTKNSTLVLFYDPENLRDTLLDGNNRIFLSQFGYTEQVNLYEYLKVLKDRFANLCPHEIGIFLGIPLKDVVEFINNKGKNYLLNRYWKVYHNLEKAKKTFDSYDCARMKVIESIKNFNDPFDLLN